MAEQNCIMCNRTCSDYHENGNKELRVLNCPICGCYIAPLYNSLLFDVKYIENPYDTEKTSTYMFYNQRAEYPFFLGQEARFNSYKKDVSHSKAKFLAAADIESWYPKTIDEKIDKVLLKIKDLSRYDGDTISVNFSKAKVLFFAHIKDCSEEVDEDIVAQQQIEFIIDALIELNYISVDDWDNIKSSMISSTTFLHVKLTPKGLAQVYYLQKTHMANKEVFVAMSFHKSANDIRKAIKQGIENARYSSLLMDEVVHNHQIVPEMLRLIKETRFMIMDITQPNFGAYYEAGYAQGLGKEVIITCSKEVWDKKDFSCNLDKSCYYKEIANKPHFDIAQKQVLVWKDYKDLTKQLAEWIKLIID